MRSSRWSGDSRRTSSSVVPHMTNSTRGTVVLKLGHIVACLLSLCDCFKKGTLLCFFLSEAFFEFLHTKLKIKDVVTAMFQTVSHSFTAWLNLEQVAKCLPLIHLWIFMSRSLYLSSAALHFVFFMSSNFNLSSSHTFTFNLLPWRMRVKLNPASDSLYFSYIIHAGRCGRSTTLWINAT